MNLTVTVALALLGVINGLGLVILAMVRADLKGIRDDLSKGSDRMREHEGEIALIRERVALVERDFRSTQREELGAVSTQ